MEDKVNSRISYKQVDSQDESLIRIIADWYLSEWMIPTETTRKRFSEFPIAGIPFQVIISFDNVPVATAGVYNEVGLLAKFPRFKIFSPWLALVYTKPDHRNKGYGTLLCNYSESILKSLEVKEIFLFTHTAEKLYKGLGWLQLERLHLDEKEIVIMKKDLAIC